MTEFKEAAQTLSFKDLHTQIDGAIDQAIGLIAFVNRFSWLPGASALLGPLKSLENTLKLVKQALDWIPGSQ